MAGNLDNTACCGIYCPDCLLLRNSFSRPARELKAALAEIGFEKYAAIESPFGRELRHYPQFMEVLDFLAATDCEKPCRPGGGCSGKPCDIMLCAEEKGLEGCWLCDEVEGCDKFSFLAPRCGNMPKENLAKIKKYGMDDWPEKRTPYYVWQQGEKD